MDSKILQSPYVIGLTAINAGIVGYYDYKLLGKPTVRNAVPAVWAGVTRGAIWATYGWTWQTLRYMIYLQLVEQAILLSTGTPRYERHANK